MLVEARTPLPLFSKYYHYGCSLACRLFLRNKKCREISLDSEITCQSPCFRICSLGRSAQTAKRKRAATRLQRQCISVLSGLALNSTGSTMRPASREAVERGMLFLAAFHWSKSVRGEAKLALRRYHTWQAVYTSSFDLHSDKHWHFDGKVEQSILSAPLPPSCF